MASVLLRTCGIGLLLTLMISGASSIMRQAQNAREEWREIRQEGYRARKANIPPQACPYRRDRRDQEQWLRGWNDAALEGK